MTLVSGEFLIMARSCTAPHMFTTALILNGLSLEPLTALMGPRSESRPSDSQKSSPLMLQSRLNRLPMACSPLSSQLTTVSVAVEIQPFTPSFLVDSGRFSSRMKARLSAVMAPALVPAAKIFVVSMPNSSAFSMR